MRSWLVAWLPVVMWLGIICVESTESMGAAHTVLMLNALLNWPHISVSWQSLEEANHILRKTGHFVGYGVLGALFTRAWVITLRAWQWSEVFRKALLFGIGCTLMVASLDEFHQSFLPGRTASPYDVLLDTCGAIALAMLFRKPMSRLASTAA